MRSNYILEAIILSIHKFKSQSQVLLQEYHLYLNFYIVAGHTVVGIQVEARLEEVVVLAAIEVVATVLDQEMMILEAVLGVGVAGSEVVVKTVDQAITEVIQVNFVVEVKADVEVVDSVAEVALLEEDSVDVEEEEAVQVVRAIVYLNLNGKT